MNLTTTITLKAEQSLTLSPAKSPCLQERREEEEREEEEREEEEREEEEERGEEERGAYVHTVQAVIYPCAVFDKDNS